MILFHSLLECPASSFILLLVLPLSAKLIIIAIVGTTSTEAPVVCASNEDHATLNYTESVQGSSELMMWLLLPDGSTLDTDITRALKGSGKWLPLPATGSDEKPIRLLIRRSLTASSWKMKFVSVSLSVVNARGVEIEVFDSFGQVAAQHQVRLTQWCRSSNFNKNSSCSSSSSSGGSSSNVRLLQLQSERYNKPTSVTQDSTDTIERKASI